MRLRHIPLCSVLMLVCPSLAGQVGESEAKQEEGKAAEQDKSSQDTSKASKARDARFKAKGWVKVEDVWVAKEHVKDAKKGIFHHDGDVLNKYEIGKFQSGMVRHPLTGQFIAAADIGKAKTQFPVADGEWGSKEEANKYHSNQKRPWIVRTTNCNIASTLPLDTILYKVAGQVDSAYNKLMPIFGGVKPPPNRRPTIIVLATQDSYAAFGADNGSGGSAHGAFLTDQFTLFVDGSRLRVGAAVWDKNWGPYYVRHATAVALNHALLGDETDDVPEWFHRALGGYVERHFSKDLARYFGAQHVKKGGVEGLKKWLSGFRISPDLPQRGKGDIGYNVYQAGLLLSFSMRGGNKKTTTALKKVTAAFTKGKKRAAAIKTLGKVLSKQEAELKAFLEKTVK